MTPGFLNLKEAVPIALAPMAGVSDMPFRLLCREQGANLFFTEMISAKALHFRNRNTWPLLEKAPEESPLGLQLFGSDPDILAEEAVKLQDRFDFIDINMGCPVHKIVGNGEGSFLLTEPALVERILKKLVASVCIPVTVKMRKGFHKGEFQAEEIARICEACGVSMISLHGRTREDFYSGQADWDSIRRIREAVRIPVIGNGDIRSGEDAVRMMLDTGCDGIMIGRAAEGNPWIFREISAAIRHEPIPERPDEEEVKRMVLRHAKMLCSFKGEHTAVLEMRRHASWYMKGFGSASLLRRELSAVKTYEEMEKLLS